MNLTQLSLTALVCAVTVYAVKKIAEEQLEHQQNMLDEAVLKLRRPVALGIMPNQSVQDAVTS